MKEQAVGILKEKVEEIVNLIPGLKNELNWSKGKTRSSKEHVEFHFKSGSVLDVIAAKASSRGKRATGGLIEECILVDQTALNEIIIPTMNVNRRLPDGSRHEEEVVNKSQVYVTTAGWKSTFAGIRKFIGEVKPCEPLSEGVYKYMLTLKVLNKSNVTVCQAA